MNTDITQKILRLASIRRFVDESLAEEDVDNRIYFDVMAQVNLPSETGNYADKEAVITTNSKGTEKWLKELFSTVVADVAIVCL